MEAGKNKKEMMIAAVKACLLILTLLSFLKGVFISLDIDESYAAALGYRMARGDRLLKDMWEPHQFSGFLAALLTASYIRLRGNTEYLIIYLRIAGALIHTGLGLFLYRRMKLRFHRLFAFGIVILHLNFLPKWIQMPEFELMHYWCLLGIFLVLDAYFDRGDKNRSILPFIGGCLLVCAILCYPTMVFLYPFYILAFYMLEKQFWKSSFLFTLGTLCSGILVPACLLRYMSFEECKRYLSYLFLDTSHSAYTMEEKWAQYFGQMWKQGRSYAAYLLIAACLVLLVFMVYKMTCREKARFMEDIEAAVIMTLTTTGLLMQGKAVYAFFFLDKNQFFFQVRYLAIILPAVFLGLRYHRRMARWFYLCILPGLLSIPAVLFVTNMDTNVTYAKAYPAVLGSFLIFGQYIGKCVERTFWKKSLSWLQYLLGGMVLAGLFVCRLLLIRVSGCLPVTVFAPLAKMESGAEKGIWVLEQSAEIWNDNYRELEKYAGKEDKVLYIGAENLIYAKLEALPATPSTLSTTTFDEMFLYYYAEHPDRIPNVIVYDKTFGEDPVYAISYAFSEQSSALYKWITENYAGAEKTETAHLIILRKE